MSRKKNDLQRFYPKELEITSVEETQDELWLHMCSRSKAYQCPQCSEKLYHLHATHCRKVQDLLILGKRVMLDMAIHDFQCLNEDCSTGAIAETFGGILNYYSRMTERLVDFVTILALEASCESRASIMQAMNVKISGDKLIRMLLKTWILVTHNEKIFARRINIRFSQIRRHVMSLHITRT